MNIRTLHLGIAIGSDSVTAVARGPFACAVTVSWTLPPSPDEAGAALTAAFTELAERIQQVTGHGVAAADVVVALLPPLAEARLVPLPPIRKAEALAVIARDAARHFVGAPSARTVAVRVPRRTTSNEAALPILAVSAPVPLVEAVRRAAAVSRWRVSAVVPAIGAWLEASRHRGRRTTDRELPLVIVAAVGDTVHVARVNAGALTTMRRVSAATPEEVVTAAGAGPGLALVLANVSMRAQLEQKLSAAGWQLMPAPAEASTAELAAAAFAGPTDLELIPESLAAQRAELQRSWALRVAVAAGLLFLGAAAVELWGARRELASVRAQRTALRPKVAPLLVARDSLMQLEQRQDLIAGLNLGSQRLTPALFDLALLLPAETHLTSLHANGDTLLIEAVGASAGEALEALRAAKSLRAVRLEGVVERELQAGATAAERFSLHARTVPLPPGAARRFAPVALPRGEEAGARRAGNGTH
jgi:hypothetical protein